MFSDTVKGKLKRFDVYRKLPQDLTEPTVSGAMVSIVACSFMILLFLSELNAYLTVSTSTEMFVDINRGGEKLIINMDLLFPRYPCGVISLDAQDIMGSHVVNIEGSMKKIRLDSSGRNLDEEDLLSHHGSMNIDAVKKQVNDKEGCRLTGYIYVNKVPGNFHISSHAYQDKIHQLVEHDMGKLDFSHEIVHLSFGANQDIQAIQSVFHEGVLSPLDSVKKIRPENVKDALSYEYYIKVVPTTYKTLADQEYYVHQFTANSNEHRSEGVPAVYFRYDLSPVTVKFSQVQESFFHFIVQVCAIVGGVFTVAGLFENLLHSSIASVLKKREEGKLG
jgi:Endoplasmic reticulum vesicle transporter/Endoplasmic Reticulum-Golgi Intermediate Compartment (ERGIC)